MTITPTAAPLQWMTNGIMWQTPLDIEGCRFLIHREAGSPLHPQFMLEHVYFSPRNRGKRIVLRQLRGIKTLAEAQRIAQEDWS